MDEKLEIRLGFDKVRTAIADRCMTEYASARAATEKFSTSQQTIRQRLAITDEMRLILMFEDSFPTTGFVDTLGFLDPLEKDGSCIDVLSLGKLRTQLDTTRRILVFFDRIKDGVYPLLKRICRKISLPSEVSGRIDLIIDKEGDVRDNASEELYGIRKSLREKEGAVSKRAGEILRQAKETGIADADASVTIRDGKYLIPVASSSKRRIQGYVYGESSTGKTSFVEPAGIVELENEIAGLKSAEQREISRILREFSEFARPWVPDLRECAYFLGEMDFLMAKAATAMDYAAGMPVISTDGGLSLRKARHPLLEKKLAGEGREMVPQTVTLTKEKHILVISGPNAGGKSVCLKTVGLLQYMFQWGMLIPTSEVSELPVFDRIMVSIGDNQSLENDLSTYSSFLCDMVEILRTATSNTLVLIDEFGSGTEPAAGGAIAEAILSELDRRGTFGVITTHFTNLKMYAASEGSGAVNGAMMFDVANIQPLFSLEMGMPGNSFAFEMARKMKLPENIVKDAENRCGEDFVNIERNLRRIIRNRKVMDEKLRKINRTDKELEEVTGRYRKELEALKQDKDRIIEDARKQADDIVKGAGKQIEKTIRDIRTAQAEKQKTMAARTELRDFISALQQSKEGVRDSKDAYIEEKLRQLEKRGAKKGSKPEAPARPQRTEPLKVGEKVRIKESGMVGEVTKVSSKSVTLAVGSIRSTLSADKVERITSNEFRQSVRKQFPVPTRKVDAAITERKLNFKTEIDLRGERLYDAMESVVRYIDDAMMVGIGTVRIIHGKGTGALHEEIQKYLRTVGGIKEVKDEDIRNGGSGVTVVTFE